MKIRALIVDDEELARSEMIYLLKDFDDIEVVGEASDGKEALGRISEKKPDLIFLDIQMPGMDGFQVVENLLDLEEVPLIIFATAYDQYAIRAFKANALDYLLKPIQKNELRESINRVREVMDSRDGRFAKRLKMLTKNINVGTKFLHQLVVRKDDELSLVKVENVALLQRIEDEIVSFTREGKFETNYREMDELEIQLDPAIFIRLGGDYFVNLKMISQIVPWTGGHYIMVLDDADNTELELTRSQAKLLKNKVEGI